MSTPFNPFQTLSRFRFPPEAQEGRLPPSLLCYCPSPQPLSLAERGGAHALSAPADRASAVPLVLLPLSPTLASRQNCCRKPCRKDTGGTPCAILFPVFSTEHLWGRRYFRNTKKTASTRQTNAAMWFQWRASPLKRRVTTKVKTMRETTSWITFSCIRLNGPPLPVNPRRLAGTWAQYSKNASPQEKRMTRMSGQLVETFIS